jgi:hypothetical protein
MFLRPLQTSFTALKSRQQFLLGIFILFYAACGGGSLIWTGGPTPARLSVAWYKANFPNCIDFCDDPRGDSLWIAIRHRPDFVNLLIDVIEDPGTNDFTRANAVLKLGSTNQDSAYSYLIRRLAEIAPSETASEWVLSLGSGYRQAPSFVYDALITQLEFPERVHPATHILSHGLGTLRAKQILERALLTVPANRRGLVETALREWKHRPERE